MTRTELFDILRPIILSVSGVPECILADPNAPAPDGEYAVVEPFYKIREFGQPNSTNQFNSGELTISEIVYRQLVAECAIDFYRGSNPHGRASKIKSCNRRYSVSSALRAANVGWHSSSDVMNLNGLQADAVEQRARIAIRIRYVEADSPEDINSIESGSVDVKVFGYTEPLTLDDSPLTLDGDVVTYA